MLVFLAMGGPRNNQHHWFHIVVIQSWLTCDGLGDSSSEGLLTRLSYRMIVPRYPIFFDRSLLGELVGAGADFTKEEPQGCDR